MRKIPRTTTIQRLKMNITKIFAKSSFDADSLVLIYHSGKNIGESYELENDYRDLNFYAVEDGDKISVQLRQSIQSAYIKFY